MGRWALALLFVGACSASTPAATTSTEAAPGAGSSSSVATTTTSVVSTTPASPGVPPPLEGFEIVEVYLDGRPLTVAVARDSATRAQGLMGITELGALDGMVFVFDGPTTASFWMKNTLIPLDIAFFDASGRLVDAFTMEPCEADPCRTYPAAGAYTYALETPVGGLASVTVASVLDVASLRE